MSIFKTIGDAVSHFFSSNPLGKALEAEASSVVHQAVAILQQTDIGAAVTAEVKTLQSSSLTGPQKFDQALAIAVPLIIKYAAGGGVALLEKDGLDIGRQLVQTIYNREVSTTAGAAASAILKASGVDVPTGAQLAAKI